MLAIIPFIYLLKHLIIKSSRKHLAILSHPNEWVSETGAGRELTRSKNAIINIAPSIDRGRMLVRILRPRI